MSVTVEMQNTGDSRVGREILVVVEHLLGDRPGEWWVLIDTCQSQNAPPQNGRFQRHGVVVSI